MMVFIRFLIRNTILDCYFFLDALNVVCRSLFFVVKLFVRNHDVQVHIYTLTQLSEMAKGDLLVTTRNQILPDTA